MDSFIAEAGLANGPLQLHLATILLGVLSFLVPIGWRVANRAGMESRGEPVADDPKRAKKSRKKGISIPPRPVDPLLFRLILFVAFTALSWQATRNSHQFAAVAGAVTAWNLGEWASEVARGRAARGKSASTSAGRLVAFGTIAGGFLLVASGGFYTWAGEGRTLGLGEERLWFPHEAVAFAGRADMPSRSICFPQWPRGPV